jgi:dihydrofolate reductase
MNVMDWFFPTRIFGKVINQAGGETGVDNAIAEKGFDNVGAWIMGRNMFTPGRGAWDMTGGAGGARSRCITARCSS